MNDRVWRGVKIAAAALFIALCAVIPSFFGRSGGPDSSALPPPTEALVRPAGAFSERSEIYLMNRAALQNDKLVPTAINEASLGIPLVDALSERLNYLLDQLTVDEGAEIALYTNGVNLYTLSNDDGVYIRVMVYYKEWDADWHNWIYLAMDADTRDIYDVYISSECTARFGYYRQTPLPTLETLASLTEAYYNAKSSGPLLSVGGERPEVTIELYPPEQGERLYKISGYTTINEASGYLLLDYRIICQ